MRCSTRGLRGPARPSPRTEDLQAQTRHYFDTEQEIAGLDPLHPIGSVRMDIGRIQQALKREAASWKNHYGTQLNRTAKAHVDQLQAKIDGLTARLGCKVQDLSDVSTLMQLLNQLRDEESKIEQWQLKPFVQTYGLLATYDVRVTKEEQDSVDALSVKWGELVALARQTMQHLRRIGPTFRVTLLQNMGTSWPPPWSSRRTTTAGG